MRSSISAVVVKPGQAGGAAVTNARRRWGAPLVAGLLVLGLLVTPRSGQPAVALAAAPPAPRASAVDQVLIAAQAEAVSLDGHHLTIEALIRVARHNAAVVLAPGALERAQQGFDLLLAAADQGIPVYGLNRGVGLNKDKSVFSGPMADAETRTLSERFNADNLRASSAGVGPMAAEELVRAAMLARLNTMLLGHTGAQPKVAETARSYR